jgi:hypothetical protein
MEQLLRYKGKWYTINPKKYEPEIQSIQVAWSMIKGLSSEESYRKFFEERQKDSRILYKEFRK